MKRVRAVIFDGGKLISIKRDKNNESYYVFPGGGVEFGEDDHEALVRECQEELGVSVEVGEFFFKEEFNGQEVCFYLCKIIGGKLGTGDGPEYQPDSNYEGGFQIELIDSNKIMAIDLRPLTVRDKIINLLSNKDGNQIGS